MDSLIIKGGQRGVKRGREKKEKCERVCVRKRERNDWWRSEEALLDVIMKDDPHTG